MPPEPRRPILSVPPVVHGAPDFAELRGLGLDPDDVLDFSANTNPYGPSPAVRAALANVPLDRYPDRASLALRQALAGALDLAGESVTVGNGASELIFLAALAFVRPGDGVVVLGPTYGEYARAARLMGGHVTLWVSRAEDEFRPDLAAVACALERLRPRVVFLCNPNNPTGAVLSFESVAGLVRRFPAALFVVDEAYQPFAVGWASALRCRADNVLVVRSMTKDYGLAGLRLGYALGPASLVEPLLRVQPPWSVNALAQAAGVAALGDPAHRERSFQRLREDKEALVAALEQLGLAPVPSAVPFFVVRVGDGAAFRQALLARRILVRDCASFGLPEHVRISTRRPEENERLVAAVREVWHR
jgi:histidinol-phosphate aminotransferase